MTLVLILILCAILWPVATRAGIRIGCLFVLFAVLILAAVALLDVSVLVET